jgi:hypothetical protein
MSGETSDLAAQWPKDRTDVTFGCVNTAVGRGLTIPGTLITDVGTAVQLNCITGVAENNSVSILSTT